MFECIGLQFSFRFATGLRTERVVVIPEEHLIFLAVLNRFYKSVQNRTGVQ